MIGQRKEFCRQRIPESVYQNNKWTSHENNAAEPGQPVLMNIYQSNAYRKGLTQLHFFEGPSVQEKQQELNQQYYILVFVTYLAYWICQISFKKQQIGAPTKALQQYFMLGCTVDLQRQRATLGERNLIEQMKSPISLEEILVLESPNPIQKKRQSHHLK